MKIFFIISIALFTVTCTATRQICTFGLNPDVMCRTCDQDDKGRKLTEVFDRDTNDLRLFVTTREGETEIEHPDGNRKIKLIATA